MNTCSVHGIHGWWWDSDQPFPRSVLDGGGKANRHLRRGQTDPLKPFVLLRFYEFLKFLNRIIYIPSLNVCTFVPKPLFLWLHNSFHVAVGSGQMCFMGSTLMYLRLRHTTLDPVLVNLPTLSNSVFEWDSQRKGTSALFSILYVERLYSLVLGLCLILL